MCLQQVWTCRRRRRRRPSKDPKRRWMWMFASLSLSLARSLARWLSTLLTVADRFSFLASSTTESKSHLFAAAFDDAFFTPFFFFFFFFLLLLLLSGTQATNHRLTVYSLECSTSSSSSSSSSYLSIAVQNHILTICSWRRWRTTNKEYVSHHVAAKRQWLGHFYSPARHVVSHLT